MSGSSTKVEHATLVAIAEGVASADPVRFVPEGHARRWGLALRTEQYEAWVIAWPSGTGLGMHDHDGSEAVIAVAAGSLRERYLTEAGVAVRSLDAGTHVELPGDHVHEVVNTGDVEALSVHVYAPPLGDLRFRDDPSLEIQSS